jgi:hypothetical protein
MFSVLKPPEIAFDDGPKAAAYAQKSQAAGDYWCNAQGPLPPADWTQPEFDDTGWLRGPIGMGCRASFVSRSCLRGKFRVTDPSQVKALKLKVTYQGGAAVYLNGKEVARKDVAAGAALAEAYPLEAFVGADGAALATEEAMIATTGKKLEDAEALGRMGLRERTLEAELTGGLMRKGVNVLAVEVVRSPYHKVVDEKKVMCWNGDPMYPMLWNTCELVDVRLTGEPAGVEPNAARPEGLQVWNSPLLRRDFAQDRGDTCETLRPIEMEGVRNGIFSGKVVIGSSKPIRGLKATASELRSEAGVIPASAVQLRYATGWGGEFGIYEYTYGLPRAPKGGNAAYPTRAKALDMLMDAPPVEYAVAGAGGAAGAVAPIWVTVRVPEDVKTGKYTGKVTVSCEGEEALEVPVELRIADWKLPQPDDFQTWTEIIQSPDTLQLEYGVPAWSDRHFELIGRSFRMMREVGSKVLYIPLICCTYYGNEESMVRWIKKGENDYDLDFTVMDKYLDAAQQNLGRPEIVCFIVWDVFMLPSKDLSVGGSHGDMPADLKRSGGKAKDAMTAPWVTTLDPATGEVRRMEFQNYFTDENSKRQWKKLFDVLHKRMRSRGLEDAMMLGWFTDCRAQQGEIDFWKEVTGDLPWVSHAHWQMSRGTKGVIKTGYNTSIHDISRPVDPSRGRTYGWKKTPVIWAEQLLRPGWRGEMDMLPESMWGSMMEIALAGGVRGFGRLGGDSWFVLKDKRGQRAARVYDRYPWAQWSNLSLCCSLFGPGPEGAVPTANFELMREGIQECEARIYIEQALTDEAKLVKLGAALAGRCQAALDERVLFELRGVANYTTSMHAYTAPFTWWFQNGVAGHAWSQSVGWQERSAKVYSLAAEVAGELDR